MATEPPTHEQRLAEGTRERLEMFQAGVYAGVPLAARGFCVADNVFAERRAKAAK